MYFVYYGGSGEVSALINFETMSGATNYIEGKIEQGHYLSDFVVICGRRKKLRMEPVIIKTGIEIVDE
ncbi:MAG: hypothetical protein GY853_14080 [PVC group bacterium]|nr:hypothetical protein [PVC group bacterium]